ncbi:MAG: polysaccharide biosynthesis/export family protein [Syntrophobacterales bacterium]|nr:polysaccharide biosynthesis/export family protein [Syntrophobacterales bacterium]
MVFFHKYLAFLAWSLMLLLYGCASSNGAKDLLVVESPEDMGKLRSQELKLMMTPEKAEFHPDYQVIEKVSVPFVPEYRIGPGDVIETIYHIRYDEIAEDYRLEVQDKISVNFPFHPQFNSTVMVRPDGKVSLPLVGDVQAASLSPRELAEKLNLLYSKYLVDPKITVALEDFNVKIKELKRSITTAPRGQSKVAPVTPDGRISLPLIGNLQAEGLTIREFEEIVNREYSKQIRNLHVTIVLLEIHHAKFYVLGEVGRPGVYEMPSRINLLDALAMAEGLKKTGNPDEVLVIRNDGLERPMAFRVNISKMLKNPQNYADVKVHPADIIYVPKTRLDSINEALERIFTRGLYTLLPFQSVFSVNYNIRR